MDFPHADDIITLAFSSDLECYTYIWFKKEKNNQES